MTHMINNFLTKLPSSGSLLATPWIAASQEKCSSIARACLAKLPASREQAYAMAHKLITQAKGHRTTLAICLVGALLTTLAIIRYLSKATTQPAGIDSLPGEHAEPSNGPTHKEKKPESITNPSEERLRDAVDATHQATAPRIPTSSDNQSADTTMGVSKVQNDAKYLTDLLTTLNEHGIPKKTSNRETILQEIDTALSLLQQNSDSPETLASALPTAAQTLVKHHRVFKAPTYQSYQENPQAQALLDLKEQALAFAQQQSFSLENVSNVCTLMKEFYEKEGEFRVSQPHSAPATPQRKPENS